MSTAYIGIGSNIDPEENIARALSLLAAAVTITGLSTFYRTTPIGRPADPSFYNGVARVDTRIGPENLKAGVLARIERDLGRKRTPDRMAARTIDLDLILYDAAVISGRGLNIPDPDIPKRAFLALPLYELDRDLILPGSGQSIREIAERFGDHGMEPMAGFTDTIRRLMKLNP